MSKGPISRIQKVPVRCSNCGKIKYNVVYKEAKHIDENKKRAELAEKAEQAKKAEQEKKINSLPPIRPQTHFITDIIANQKRLADMYADDTEK